MKRNFSREPLVALEIGTSTVRVVIGEVREEDGHIVLTGCGEMPSRGVRKGEIIDHKAAEECVKAALAEAEEQTNVVINQVLLMFSAGSVQSLVNRGQIPISTPDGVVDEETKEKVRDATRAVSMPNDRELIHSIPQKYYIDDGEGLLNPVGLGGALLKLDMLILHGLRNRIQNVARVARDTGVDVEDIAHSGLCAGLAVLDSDQKERGALVIDLGGGTTNFTIYANKAIAMASTIAVGGDHVTNDIAHGLDLPGHLAEKLKIQHGSAVMDLSRRDETVVLDQETDVQERRFKRVDLDSIIHARMEETLHLVRDELVQHKLMPRIGAGVVFTGGGAAMPGLVELGRQVFHVPCKVGHARNVSGLADLSESPDLAAPIGMLKYGLSAARRDGVRHAIGDLLKRILKM